MSYMSIALAGSLIPAKKENAVISNNNNTFWEGVVKGVSEINKSYIETKLSDKLEKRIKKTAEKVEKKAKKSEKKAFSADIKAMVQASKFEVVPPSPVGQAQVTESDLEEMGVNLMKTFGEAMNKKVREGGVSGFEGDYEVLANAVWLEMRDEFITQNIGKIGPDVMAALLVGIEDSMGLNGSKAVNSSETVSEIKPIEGSNMSITADTTVVDVPTTMEGLKADGGLSPESLEKLNQIATNSRNRNR